eukprot:CFRG7856T1
MMKLRAKTDSGSHTIEHLSGTSTVSELLQTLSALAGAEQDRIKVLCGYPPHQLTYESDKETLESIRVKSGECFIVNVEPMAEQQSAIKFSTSYGTGYRTVVNSEVFLADASKHVGNIVRRVVPDDNSCLFTSISLLLLRDAKGSTELRNIVASTIMADPVKYNEAMLGQAVEDYVQWIQYQDSWGGAIDISILASYFQTEIVVCDTQTLRLDRFGSDCDYKQRIMIIYDGVHYDALALTPWTGAPQEQDTTVFSTSDDGILKKCLELSTAAHKEGKFTDLAGFTLRCSYCRKGLVGQKDAVSHAKETGHQKFEEYK